MFHYSLNPRCRRHHHRRHHVAHFFHNNISGNSRQNYHVSGSAYAWFMFGSRNLDAGKARRAWGMNGITPALIFALRCVTFFLL